MNNRAGRPEGPENVDQAFAEIVADLRRDGVGAGWPEATDEAQPVMAGAPTAPIEVPDLDTDRTEGADGNRSGAGDRDHSEDDHYVPPEPPPLPPLRGPTVLALVLVLIGLFLLIAPGLIGLGTGVAMPLALIAISGGIGVLILSLRNGPARDGWDDGARL